MNIVWFSWKDRWHPLAGGAETVSGEIMDRLARDGHNITLITAAYPGATRYEAKRGVSIYRAGNRFTVYIMAFFSFKKLQKSGGKPDIVIDEMNTIPFLSGVYTHASKKVLLAYQLAREVWFYQMPPVLSHIGYIVEPLYLWIVSKIYPLAMTESHSSKKDMEAHGFKNVSLFSVGMALKPKSALTKKQRYNTVLSLGAVRPMKRTLDAVKAFEHAHDLNPNLTMIVAGENSSNYGAHLARYTAASRAKNSISIVGRVSAADRLELMREAGAILVTSAKEGWGLIVTEANSQGTPAVVYDVDGLRDSVKHLKSGIISKDGDPAALGTALCDLLDNPKLYEELRENAWEWSKEFTFENSYREFCKKTNIS